MDGDYDYIIVHDPQPAALRELQPGPRRALDLALPHRPLDAQHGRARADGADGRALRLQGLPPAGSTCPAGVDGKVEILPPAIDPLSPKNMALSPEDAAFVCDQFGVDVDRPLICQVSRFDPWKDPLGVIDAYRSVKEQVEGVQLALVGSMATDDPEGWDFFQQTHEHAAGDEDIKILNNLNNVGAIEVNAFQSQADVVLQKSIREGFGLTVSEALWKARPDDRRQRRRHPAPDPGRRDRLPRQLARGGRGALASRSSSDPELGKRLGRAGKEYVRTHFLMPRLLRDWLRIFTELRRLVSRRRRWLTPGAPAGPALQPRAGDLRARRVRRARARAAAAAAS